MPRSLVIRHHLDTGAGWVGERLEELGFAADILDLGDAAPAGTAQFPEPGEHDVAVILGAVWSVNDVDVPGEPAARWLAPELDWTARAVAADVPVLGICFGAQVLGRALGGTVEAMPRPQIGWWDVPGSAAAGLPAGPWAQFHGDAVRVLPPGATALAADEFCQQAFAIGRSLAVQFHPEVGPDDVAVWASSESGQAAVTASGIDLAAMLERGRKVEADAHARAHALVDAWLAL